MKIIDIKNGWTTDNLSPNDYEVNLKRKHNWMAKVNGYDNNGKEIREYFTESNASDTYFFVGNKISQGDIIAVGIYDRYKPKFSVKKYYKVLNVDAQQMEVSEPQTTYLKAMALENNSNDSEKKY